MTPTLLRRRPAWRTAVLLLALVLFLAPPLLAETPFDGHWEGAIDLPTGQLEIDVDLESDAAGTLSGDITIPVQSIRDRPLGGFEADGEALIFTIPGIPGDPTFDGELSADGDVLSGTFRQGGGQLSF